MRSNIQDYLKRIPFLSKVPVLAPSHRRSQRPNYLDHPYPPCVSGRHSRTHSLRSPHIFLSRFDPQVPASRLEMLGEMSQFEIFAAGEDVCTEGSEGAKV